MSNETIYCVPRSNAVRYAAGYLSAMGLSVTDAPDGNVTHLLLPVPSFLGGDDYLAEILAPLSENVTVVGGNLNSLLLKEYQTVDLLQDPYYLAENAAITARCALRLVDNDLSGAQVLVLGWGRIGKCLGKLLEQAGAEVTIAARKDSDLAMIQALGYHSIPICKLQAQLYQYDAILNTVPAMVLDQMQCREDCTILELASIPGMAGENIISARGLPGKMAPEESGKLIAERVKKLILNKEEI